MKHWRLCSALLISACCRAQDAGGRDVSIALFSTHPVRSITVTPLSAGTWIAHCAACAHQPLTQSLHVAGTMEVFAGGTLGATEDATGANRTATGLWHLRATAAHNDVDVILTLPSERYVTAVLNAEAAPNEPPQSLRALAILARTYALNARHYTAQPGHLAAELCDSTACQAILLQPPSPAVEDAVRSTVGETLWFGARRADVFFSQNCGGLTESAGAVWPSLGDRPYLQSHADPFCVRRDRDAWHASVPLDTFSAIAKNEGWRLPADIVAAQVMQRSASHRALRIQFTGSRGETAVIAASAVRFGIGRALGWNQVRSDAYELGMRHGALVFDGRGHGHGVGLCQAGATQMAVEGKSAREILAFYFPGTVVRVATSDEGWREVHAGPLAIRSVQLLSATHQASLTQTWAEAQKRFPPHRSLTPTIILAPSTELFRQLTGQPGWMLASTQADTIVLQPEAILRTQQRNEDATVLHEMLHVAVESECNPQTPLWLREGLVEVLAGDRISEQVNVSTQQMEADLLHSASQAASERAHMAAAAKVRDLILHYGMSVVRGWLSSRLPTGVS